MMKNFTHIQIVINDHWHIYVIVSYIVNSKQLFVPLHWTKLNNKILKLSYLTKQSVYPANQVTRRGQDCYNWCIYYLNTLIDNIYVCN